MTKNRSHIVPPGTSGIKPSLALWRFSPTRYVWNPAGTDMCEDPFFLGLVINEYILLSLHGILFGSSAVCSDELGHRRSECSLHIDRFHASCFRYEVSPSSSFNLCCSCSPDTTLGPARKLTLSKDACRHNV